MNRLSLIANDHGIKGAIRPIPGTLRMTGRWTFRHYGCSEILQFTGSSGKILEVNLKLISFYSLLLCFGGTLNARSLPVQGSTAIPLKPDPTLPSYMTDQISRDWSDSNLALANQPDHSMRTVWVRMFPLATVPLGDPYPETIDINNIDLSNSTAMTIYALDTLQVLGSSKTLHLDFSKPTFKIGPKSVPLQKLWIVPAGTGLTTLNWDTGKKTSAGVRADVGLRMRGQFVVKQTMFESDNIGKPHFAGQQLWSVMNLVNINNYIESVVPSEIISSWGEQTLRAQAIAARTYGMFEVAAARALNSDWDVDPTTWYQSYRGAQFWDRTARVWRGVELASTTKAVSDTKGEVMTHKGQIIKAYFSANSGGRTCLVSECFNLPDLPYIQEIADAPGVESMPGGTWGKKANLTAAAIRDKLISIGITPAHAIDSLQSLERGPSGRTWRLRVLLKGGVTPIDLDALQSRKIMHLYGPIRSFLYELGDVGSDGKQGIVGHGYGHGVGLSQWGAQTLSKQGWDAHRILKYYYKDVDIQKFN